MNKERAKELLPFIQALAEGKQIQWKTLNGWIDYADKRMVFDGQYQYRIKPEEPLLSHEEILRMWWKMKNFSGWCRVIGYEDGKYYLKHMRYGYYKMTAEELFKDWEYAEIPPEEK